ncbi:MAG TPA: hypothetical protein VNA30_03225 [Mycobacteriales bacterium]|nr:hypothetical protein [Mycobacteriales bacterium]
MGVNSNGGSSGALSLCELRDDRGVRVRCRLGLGLGLALGERVWDGSGLLDLVGEVLAVGSPVGASSVVRDGEGEDVGARSLAGLVASEAA